MGLIVDPGAGLQDLVDDALLEGATGVNIRFSLPYDVINGNIDAINVNSAEIATLTGIQTFTGAKTFTGTVAFNGDTTFGAGNLKIAGAGAGIATVQNANTATDRTLTIPDPGADADFVMTEGNQTINGTKTFSDLAFSTLILPSGAAPATDGAITNNSNNIEVFNTVTSRADQYLREDGITTKTFNGGDISLGTGNDGSFVDVDATNAAITFTVNVPGMYIVTFDYAIDVLFGTGGTRIAKTRWRLTDGTNFSSIFLSAWSMETIASFTSHVKHLHYSFPFDFTTTGSKTVKLQKRNDTTGTISSYDLKASTGNDNGELFIMAYRISN